MKTNNNDSVRVSPEEVMELLKRVGDGEVIPKLKDPEADFGSVFAGNVVYDVDGWHVEIFNDCNEWDYVNCVKSPDGREGEFEDWFGPEDEEGTREWRQPDDLLGAVDDDCRTRMERAFISAT